MTNQIMLVTLVLSNWTQFNNDWKREGQTNYVKKELVVATNMYAEVVTLCTNRVLLSGVTNSTGVTKWEAVGPFAVPPLPGARTRE